MRTLKRMVLAATLTAAMLPSMAFAEGEKVMTVPGFADFLAADGLTVWATNKGKVEHWSRDGKLGEVLMTHPCGAMAIEHGSLWVADCQEGTLNRIDIATSKLIASIPTGIANPQGELNVVAGAGSIWVASDAKGVVSRVDPATNSVIASIPVDPGTWYMAFGFGSVWAVSASQQTLQRIDPATNSVVGKTPLGKEPGFLAAGAGGVWVQEQADGTVARVDPDSGKVTGRVKVGDNLKWGDIDVGHNKVWLRTTDDQVFVVIKGLKIEERVGKAAGSGALRFTDYGLWTTAHDEHTLTWWPPAVLMAKP
ncbi:YncE family protein [Novosphingobium sp. BL-8H]|uniref:Vgb family protein n=1 Tax=Novosphingobium sp. BL-8H TaxID=3127640 RepID=UPI0037572E7F